jgi:hypothetical protein
MGVTFVKDLPPDLKLFALHNQLLAGKVPREDISLSSAFDWSNSPEKHKFWSVANRKFLTEQTEEKIISIEEIMDEINNL